VAKATALLDQGDERATDLAQGHAPWTTATSLVVRGYISKIDHSVQPYGLVVPPSYSPTAPHRWRLDAWFYGRNETLSEINFPADRTRNFGEFAPRDTIVLHLYGRFCNASRFAGEVDFFEALDAVKRRYAIDETAFWTVASAWAAPPREISAPTMPVSGPSYSPAPDSAKPCSISSLNLPATPRRPGGS
jgi:hypothetical protein